MIRPATAKDAGSIAASCMKTGFAPVGILRNVGFKLTAGHDVGIYQLQLAAKRAASGEPLPFPSDQSR